MLVIKCFLLFAGNIADYVSLCLQQTTICSMMDIMELYDLVEGLDNVLSYVMWHTLNRGNL